MLRAGPWTPIIFGLTTLVRDRDRDRVRVGVRVGARVRVRVRVQAKTRVRAQAKARARLRVRFRVREQANVRSGLGFEYRQLDDLSRVARVGVGVGELLGGIAGSFPLVLECGYPAATAVLPPG